MGAKTNKKRAALCLGSPFSTFGFMLLLAQNLASHPNKHLFGPKNKDQANKDDANKSE